MWMDDTPDRAKACCASQRVRPVVRAACLSSVRVVVIVAVGVMAMLWMESIDGRCSHYAQAGRDNLATCWVCSRTWNVMESRD